MTRDSRYSAGYCAEYGISMHSLQSAVWYRACEAELPEGDFLPRLRVLACSIVGVRW